MWLNYSISNADTFWFYFEPGLSHFNIQ